MMAEPTTKMWLTKTVAQMGKFSPNTRIQYNNETRISAQLNCTSSNMYV